MPEAVSALRTLASLPDTFAAVISGRSLRDLALLSRLPHEVHLVGSHGSEFDPGFAGSLAPECVSLLDRIAAFATGWVESHKGVKIETKPAGVAFHVRGLAPANAAHALAAVLTEPARWDGVQVRRGHDVIELSVVATDKGRALSRLRHDLGAGAVLYVGDDLTDEDAFGTLAGPDLGVKVGAGDTIAGHRLDEPGEVARLLAVLAEARRNWLAGSGATPLEHHTLLSDQRTVALVTDEGDVVWLCHPRVDSSAIFASILGGARAGFFRVRHATAPRPISQRYVEASMVCETRWPGVVVTDYLDTAPGLSHTTLVRTIEGDGPVDIEFAPRLDFGRVATGLDQTTDGLVVTGSSDRLVLRSSSDLAWRFEKEGHHTTARARVAIQPDRPLVLVMEMGGAWDGHGPDASIGARPLGSGRAETIDYWQQWVAGLTLPDFARAAVVRSALLLKALFVEQAGSFVAAATTSLPEEFGGTRNWDYRFSWIRDASLAASALARLGSTHEARNVLDWVVARAADHGPERLRPVYTVDGHDLAPEAVIAELSGYSGSRPVRIGNAADRQIQLDLFGPVTDLMALLAGLGVAPTEPHLDLLSAMVEAVARRWTEPDHGIWEVRDAPAHHTHSKTMCWVTVDRALAIYPKAGRQVPDHWATLRDAIARDVLEHGWSGEAGSFVSSYGSNDLDAAALHVGLSGLISPDDHRFWSTVNAIETRLRDGPVVRRYQFDDGLPGREGGFLVCASWLVDAYALIGRITDARELFAQIVDLAGPTGVLTEQYDPSARRALGNLPQTYSHHGLIDNAVRLAAM